MLTDHEQLANNEARIARQQIPLAEPLENISQITKDLENLHNGNARLLLAAHALGGICARADYAQSFSSMAIDAVYAADATLAALKAK